MSDKNAEGKVDEGKGRVKEAAGSLTDDSSLKNEGKVDKAAGKTQADARRRRRRRRRRDQRRRRQGEEDRQLRPAGRGLRRPVASRR